MVGGLVEEEEVGLGEQQPGQRDAHLPATAEGVAGLVPVLGAEPQAVQHPADALVDGEAAGHVKRGELGVQALDRALVAAGDGVFGGGDPRLEGLHGGHARARLVPDALGAARHRALRQPAELHVAAQLDPAVIDQDLAGDGPEQRGLAGAVATDQADLVAGVDDDGGVDQQVAPADRQRDVLDTKHGARLVGLWRPVHGPGEHRGRRGGLQAEPPVAEYTP